MAAPSSASASASASTSSALDDAKVLCVARLSQKVFAASRALRYDSSSAATACLYVHKYINFMIERQASFAPSQAVLAFLGIAGDDGDDDESIIILTATLFLVGKVSENARRPRDVLNVVRSLFGRPPESLEIGEAWHVLKDHIIQREHALLRILGFETHVDLPHPYLLNIANYLGMKKLAVKAAWQQLNDTYLRDTYLRKEVGLTRPVVVACACLMLGMEMVRLRQKDEQESPSEVARLFAPFEVAPEELAAALAWIRATPTLLLVDESKRLILAGKRKAQSPCVA